MSDAKDFVRQTTNDRECCFEFASRRSCPALRLQARRLGFLTREFHNPQVGLQCGSCRETSNEVTKS